MGRHKIKKEEASSSTFRKKEDNDLAYYIHDRVELMHQVFLLLKSKEIKSIAPECVKNLSIDDLEELCLEELLGISSKRLLAVLDGAEPPSDTSSSESDNSQRLESISLDGSVEIVDCTEGRDKCRKKRSKKSKSNKRSKPSTSAAPRPGATVLELLELQARARAIRAQLAAEHAEKSTTEHPTTLSDSADDDDVMIKEEEPEIVELSTDDEKPNIQELHNKLLHRDESHNEQGTLGGKTVTKKNELIIIKPQSQTKKIKLIRPKPTPSTVKTVGNTTVVKISEKSIQKTNPQKSKKSKGIYKRKSININKDTNKEKEHSDHDEITLQLSDTEQMELEEFDRNKYNKKVSVSSDSDIVNLDGDNTSTENFKDDPKELEDEVMETEPNQNIENFKEKQQNVDESFVASCDEEISRKENDSDKTTHADNIDEMNDTEETTNKPNDNNDCEKSDLGIDGEKSPKGGTEAVESIVDVDQDVTSKNNNTKDKMECKDDSDKSEILSEGEVSDHSSSEVEAFEVPEEIVCISDDESNKKQKKKKFKKDKKSKKDKKRKDFRKVCDENFYKDSDFDNEVNDKNAKLDAIEINEPIKIESDENYELFEISDDNSSCYEVEGISVLSKEPTSEEIEALSAKIDNEFEREEVVTDEQIRIHENNYKNESGNQENVENMSWKDRYLSSTKVKKVLCTSNILNAIRKKNIELKKKIEETKHKDEIPHTTEKVPETAIPIEEGTIEQFNKLESSSKYVDPPKEVDTKVIETNKTIDNTEDIDGESNASAALIRDARQLLKMYKKLLKECGMKESHKVTTNNKKCKEKVKENCKDDQVI